MNEVGGKLGEERGWQCLMRPGVRLLEGGHLSIGCVIRRFWARAALREALSPVPELVQGELDSFFQVCVGVNQYDDN